MTRIALPALLLCCAIGAATVPMARLAAQVRPRYGAPLDSVTTVRVAENAWAFIAPDSRNSLVSGNMLLVVGEDAALVVDAGHFPSLTRRVIADIGRLTPRPVRWLVNTHWHEDHLLGNPEFVAAYPGITIVASTPTRAAMLERVPRMLDDERRAYPAYLARVDTMVRTGRRAGGAAITPFEREHLREEHADYVRFLPELASARAVPPSLAFADSLVIDLGQREVRLLFVGRGNTAGDVVAWVPDARLVATGDLVVAPSPYAFGSFIGEWPATLDRLMALDATVIVPGHGPVMRDWSYARLVRELVDAVGTQARAAVKAGLAPDAVRRRVDVAALRRRFTEGDARREKLFDDFFLRPALDQAIREAQAGEAQASAR